jgi:glycine cleavage system aminomethyltransferase T
LTVGEGDPLTVYGGEAVRRSGQIVGRVRSCAYGYTVGAMVALASLDAGLPEGAELSVDVFDGTAVARVRGDVLYDPAGARLRG